MKTFFIHLRYYNEEDKPYNTGGITIAYRDEKDHYRVAYSRCHWNDNFCKRIGRNIATGRLASGDYYNVPASKDVSAFENITSFILRHIDLISSTKA